MTATTARSRAVASESRQIEASQQRAVAAREAEQQRPRTAMEAMAQRLSVSPSSLQTTLKATAFKGCSDAEFVALVIVANTYELNPLLREIYAFPKKGGGIQAIVGYDGWIKIANSHPQFDGFEFDHILDEKGIVYAVEGVLHRKDRGHPTKKMVYLKEFKRNTDPWNNSPNHMLDVRCFCQTVRLGLGVALGVEGDENLAIDGGMLRSDPVSLPSAKSLGEELNDEIPHMDKGEHIDPDTGEVIQRDSRGMTEVDEDTARQLDGNDGTLGDDNPAAEEGPAQAQRGEASNGADEEPVWLEAVRGIRGSIAAAKTIKAIENIERDWTNRVMNGVSDEATVREVDKQIAAKKRDLKAKAEG